MLESRMRHGEKQTTWSSVGTGKRDGRQSTVKRGRGRWRVGDAEHGEEGGRWRVGCDGSG